MNCKVPDDNPQDSVAIYKARVRRFQFILVLLIVALIVGMMIDMYIAAKRNLDGTPAGIYKLADLSQRTELTFPHDTLFLGGIHREGWHYNIVAKVRVPRSELKVFLSQAALDPLTEDSGNPVARQVQAEMSNPKAYIDHIAGWDVGSMRRFHVAQWDIAHPLARYTNGLGEMLIDLDDPKSADVYLWVTGD